jgi:hypothetical protein
MACRWVAVQKQARRKSIPIIIFKNLTTVAFEPAVIRQGIVEMARFCKLYSNNPQEFDVIQFE